MYIIKKLPVLLPLVVSILLCFLGIYYKFELNDLSYKLAIAIIIFYLVGYYLRNFVIKFLQKALEQNEEKARLIQEYELENQEELIEDSFNDV